MLFIKIVKINKLKKEFFEQSLQSYLGILKHCDGWKVERDARSEYDDLLTKNGFVSSLRVVILQKMKKTSNLFTWKPGFQVSK